MAEVSVLFSRREGIFIDIYSAFVASYDLVKSRLKSLPSIPRRMPAW